MTTEDDELSSDFIAFNKAGSDQHFTIFKIYTRALHDSKTGETGQFHFECQYDITRIERHRNPVGLIKYLTRKYLLHGKVETGVPFEQWIVEYTPVFERYNIPSHLFLDTTRDRAWLL